MLKKYQEFIPKTFIILKRYNWGLFKKDLFAGLTVAMVSLPVAMAFAIASGVTPERGLYTAIVGGFLVSLLGGSRVQIGGPAGAFVVIVYGIVQKHGYDGLVMATLIASFLLIGMGLFRLGSLIKYVPYPLIVGFTTGLAIIIFSVQIKDFLGLSLEQVPAHFLDKWNLYFRALPQTHFLTLGVSLGSLGLIVVLRRYFSFLPWGITTIFIVTALCWGFHIPTLTIIEQFGQLPTMLPSPHFNMNMSKFFTVIPDAITIALLAGIESLLCAVIADSLTGGRHRSNCELIAQGIGNLGSILFGGICVTAAVARTATNIKAGAQTPVAGMIHAITLLAVLAFFSSLVGHIPLAALSAVLIVVAWNMADIAHFIHLLKAPRGDVWVLLTSTIVTVLVGITEAVEIGMVLAAFLFMRRMSNERGVIFPRRRDETKGIEEYEIKGPFFFGVAHTLKEIYQHLDKTPKIFVLRMKHVPVLDITGMNALKDFHNRCLREETQLILSEVQQEPAELLQKFGLGSLIQKEIEI